MVAETVLEVERLRKFFPIVEGLFNRQVGLVRAVDDISFRVREGETFALVGESGAGKSTVGKLVVGLIRPTAGAILFDGTNITADGGARRDWRRQLSIVFQDPASSLNPKRRVADIVATPLEVYRIGTAQDRFDRVRQLLGLVELPEKFLFSYPHALSGGQKQRIAIARALALNPRLIVLDEPTSALDVSVQAKILELLLGLKQEFHLTYVLITHDLSVVRNFADRVGVMYLGKIAEVAPTEELFTHPLHPYTITLLSSIPVVSDEEFALLPRKAEVRGEIPSPANIPPGCPYHTRCYAKMAVCEVELPPLIEVAPEHLVACHLYPLGTAFMPLGDRTEVAIPRIRGPTEDRLAS